MSFRTFDGSAVRSKRVALGGRSRAEESREQVLERTRQDRERRKQQKLESRSATAIQAAWRAWHGTRLHKAAVRAAWVEAYGSYGQLATSEDLQPSSSFLRALVYFADPSDPEDTKRLSAACSLILASQLPPPSTESGSSNLHAEGQRQQQQQQQQQQRLQFCKYAAQSWEARHAIAQRAQRLAGLALRVLAANAGTVFQEQLGAPRQGVAAAAAATAGAEVAQAAPLLEAVIGLAGPDAWKTFLPAAEAGALAARILAHLVRHGLFEQLARMLAAACPEQGPAAAGGGARPAVPAAEALATALVVRYLALQGPIVARLKQQYNTAAPFSEPGSSSGNPLRASLAALLCVPLLVQRCPSLRPVAGRVWLQGVAALQGGEPGSLATWLPGEVGQQGRAGAAAALLGNLVQIAPLVLKAEPVQPPRKAQAAVQFVGVLSTLLRLLPLQPFFQQGAGWAEDDDGGSSGPGGGYQGLPPPPPHALLAWDLEQLPPAALVTQVQLLTSAGFLQTLVAAILPHASAQAAAAAAEAGGGGGLSPAGAAGAAAAGPGQLAAANGHASEVGATAAGAGGLAQAAQQLGVRERAAAVRSLCALLYRVMLLPGQRTRVLIGLAMHAELVQRMWYSYLRAAHAAKGEGWAPSNDDSVDPGWMLPLTLFSRAYSSFIIIAGDNEVYDRQRPLPLAELYSDEQPKVGVLSLLKYALWQALWAETPPSPGGWSEAAAGLRSAFKSGAGKLLGQLYDRNCRRGFAPAEAFQADALPPDRFHSEMQAGTAAGRALTDAGSTRAWGLLTYAPYLVPFHERARVFQEVVSRERARYRDMDVSQSLFGGLGMETNRFVTIRRNQLLQDSYEKLSALGEGVRGRIRVQFISEHGLEEAGVDGGGIFKEFLEEVVRQGFNPDLGLFLPTTDQRLYPNPHVRALLPDMGLRLVEFLGRMLGKAMYEGLLVELPLAGFFLKKFRGMYCDINDLPTLDPQLYKSLMFLKTYEGDVSELGLTFTVADNVLGQQREVELVPGGHDKAVTNENVTAYMHRVADYKLNQQIREPTTAFLRGLHTLIQPEWVSMFNEEELQMLISGGQQGLDIADMRANVQYSGGYHEDHPVIQEFWAALSTFTPEEQADFLRFITSCPRPPLLGFKYLAPPLCIQMAGSVLDPAAVERLPTAATCMNLLKLPPYQSAQLIRDKLLYAVQAGAGFELS